VTISSNTLIGLLYDSPDGTLPCVPVTRRRSRVGPDGRNPFVFDRATLTDVLDRGLVVRDGEQLRITQLGRATVSASRASIADAAAAREKRRLARRRGRCTLCGATWPGRTDDEARTGHAEHIKTAHPALERP
jgi:hypothetical protein